MTLCDRCQWMREVISGRGSRFLLCRRSATDHAFPKYPPQPVFRCPGFELRTEPPSKPVDEYSGDPA